ncbi:MAG: aldo/keto reductase [Myxococcota bacterium]|nr:aldo/keto reductase [Myxococcota bacterium]
MDEITIGASGLRVPRIGIGAMPWSDSTGFGYGSKLGLGEARGAFEACVSAGVRLFDTAEIYGFGKSERILGELVRKESRPTNIATKYAPYPWRLGRGTLVKALKRSLGRLGVESVDLYQIHFPTPWASIPQLMEGLADAVEAGLTRTVGVSNYSADQMREAHAALARRGIPLASNQVEYSLVKRTPETNGVLDACRQLDVALIAYCPLGRGALSGKYKRGASPSDRRRRTRLFQDETLERMAPLLAGMREVGRAHGDATPAQVALNWLARQSHVLPIPGAKNETQARDNAAALDWTMSESEAARLDALSESFRSR